MVRVDEPAGALGEGGKIQCRQSRKYELKFQGLGVKQNMVEAKKMMEHEDKCKASTKEEGAGNSGTGV